MRGLSLWTLPVMDRFSCSSLRICLADGLVDVADRTSVRMSREAGLKMQIFICIKRLIALMISVCPVLEALSEHQFRKAERPSATFGWPVRSPSGVRTKHRDQNCFAVLMIIGNENDQVSKGQLVDALACTGDEGRDTLR